MVTIVKHEWHHVDSQFAFELTEELLAEIYPDLDEDEIAEKLVQVETGDIDIDELVSDAEDVGVYIEWDRQYDDWWTERKGGYDVTYELGDDTSWVSQPEEAPHTHKCTKCRWTGNSYNTLTQHLREDGSDIYDYYNTEEESHGTKDVCPMCDSDVELTEHGQAEKSAKEKSLSELENNEEE